MPGGVHWPHRRDQVRRGRVPHSLPPRPHGEVSQPAEEDGGIYIDIYTIYNIYNIYIICNQVWTEKGGVNYTLTATEMIGQAVMKLQNKTLRVTTTTVRSSRSSRYHHHHEWCQIVDKSPGMKQKGFKLNQKGCRLVRKKTVLSFELNYLQQLPFSVSV